MSLENWRCLAIGVLSGVCSYLLCDIIRIARSAAFKRDLKKLREQRRAALKRKSEPHS